MYLTNATVANGLVKEEGYSDITKGYFGFSLIVDEGASGKASIDSTGKITISNSFGLDEYIKVVVKLYVSGTDRDFDKNENLSSIKLGEIRLGLKRPQTGNT